MAEKWKGTVLEPHTVILLSMLLQEDGTLTAERRHDCHSATNCIGIGIMGHSTCSRGTPQIYVREGKPQKRYCGRNAQKQFEEAYPEFASDWREQFREYTLRMTDLINDGYTANQAIMSWNSREVGRIAKVEKHKYLVTQAIQQ